MGLRDLVDKALGADEEKAAVDKMSRQIYNAEHRAEVSKREADHWRQDYKALESEINQVRAELATYSGPAQVHPAWQTDDASTKEHVGIVGTMLSDLHIGEVVDPDEMAGYNKFDMRIARMRTERFFTSTINLTRNYLNGVKYEGAVLAIAGDVVSGDIHEELTRTNETSTYESAEAAVDWIGSGIESYRSEYGNVTVYIVPGNHGRYWVKPVYKRRSASNADMHIGRLLRRDFKNTPGVEIIVPRSSTVDFQIYNTKFRMEHLDEAHGGSGIAGALSPLLLRVHRMRKVAEAEGRPFDVLMGGHWHQLMMMPGQGLIVNGALKGYDEFARGKAFAPEPPQQAFFVVTPERGVTFPSALFVQDRDAEGW